LVTYGSGPKGVHVHAGLLLADIAPELVKLQPGRADADHHPVVKLRAAATDFAGKPPGVKTGQHQNLNENILRTENK
jgi:hypothetical protein